MDPMFNRTQECKMYVIYHTTGKHRFYTHTGSVFSEARIAKSVLTKAIKRGELKEGEYKVATVEEWRADDQMVTVKNCLTGQDVQIRMSERGGVCDPSMERYHTM
jgi:hypothetical protein